MGALMREAKLAASTRAKHLRVLGACLNSAIQHGYAAKNPVKQLPKSEKPRPEKKEAAYFENDELPKLFASIPGGVYRSLFLTALMTGMRQGELAALTWRDVDLIGGVARVRSNYTARRLSTPKGDKRRDVDLTPEVVDLLGEWWGECGSPEDAKLVFPGGGKEGYLCTSTITQRQLYPAMTRAGIPREGPTGEKRTFHSFRHTFAKSALERGATGDVAQPPPRPLDAQGDDGHLRALGAQRAKAAGQDDGWRVHVSRTNCRARDWYERYGFEASPTDPLHLMLLMKELRKFVEKS